MNDNIIQLDFTIINCHCEAQPVPSELRESNPGLVVTKHYFERSGIGKRNIICVIPTVMEGSHSLVKINF